MASTACFLHHHAPSTTTRIQSTRLVPINKPNLVVCKAQKQAADDENNAAVSRRMALTVLLGAAALGAKVAPADAAYGEAGTSSRAVSPTPVVVPKTNTDFLPYAGDGFKLMVPSKWNPSKEVEYPGQVLRYEDNFDSNSNVNVMVTPTTKSSITDYGTPEEFLSQTTTQESGGKKYYFVSVLTRTADGDEGGKHQLITATVSDGKLYICKAQAGDKRWFKGARKFVESAASSFNVA
ncbi:hypothetical protein B296_00014335 [Ensete ventricosum]|uniref:23 kDa subunit of oxygen evolving system of photosystem II n=1 Tax=Ensete ventricosum TaxID=4639 RepID=A0A426ZWR5_ENSVE|nr:hypothetical protein B296_00014335 [Ensete ventricosum]